MAQGFKNTGVDVDIFEVKDVREDQLDKYDLLHIFHVFKSFIKIGPIINDMSKLVISFTGTDIMQLKEMKEDKGKIVDLLNKAKKIIVFHKEAKEELIEQGLFKDKIEIIGQTPIPIERDYIFKKQKIEDLKEPACINFIFASGIRKVKGPLKLIDMMEKLVEKVENVRLVIIGPILEEELGNKFKEKIKDKKWVEYLGEFSQRQVKDFILKAHVVINNSTSEGMSSTLLEAQQLGKPILATDVSGNRAIVSHGLDGYLFKNQDEFEFYASRLVEDRKLREEMALAALKSSKKYSLAEEIGKYEKVYKS